MVELLGLGPDAASTLSLLVATLSLALSAWLLVRQQRGEHGGVERHKATAPPPPPAGLLNVKAFDAVAAAPPPAGLLNVKAFGAVGDGKVDDTAAVQRALDAMTSGDTLVFPKGVYSVASTLYVGAKGGDPKYRQDGLTLTGDGVGSVILGSFRGPKWYGEHCMRGRLQLPHHPQGPLLLWRQRARRPLQQHGLRRGQLDGRGELRHGTEPLIPRVARQHQSLHRRRFPR